MRRTKEDAEQTRLELLKKAVKVFNSKGYVRTRLEDIAKAAGVTRGAIYHHFGNKAELFKAIYYENSGMVDRVIAESIDSNKGPVESMKEVLTALFVKIEEDDFFREFQEIMEKTKFVDELKPLESEMQKHDSDGFKIFQNGIEEGKELGLIRKDVNSKLFTFSVIGSFIGIIRFWRETNQMVSLKENAAEITDYMFTGILEK